MSPLNTTGLYNRPILVDRVVDLSSRKIESISRIGLTSPNRNQIFWGGGGRVGILDTDVSRYGPKETSKERFSGKNRFASLPSFLE